jgi:RimJ/RimL family protein N-acetyltransferase
MNINSKSFPFNTTPVLVLELSITHLEKIRTHLIDLSEEDRLLRFGMFASDAFIDNYVHSFDFERDVFFGVFNHELALVGFSHLAYSYPRGNNSHDAEFGVSVSESGRGIGIGTALFKRAAIHCRNSNIKVLFVHCLSSNEGMMHIARKAGMAVEKSHGEAEAYLRIQPGNQASILKEALDGQVAVIDYSIKQSFQQAMKFAMRLYKPRKFI